MPPLVVGVIAGVAAVGAFGVGIMTAVSIGAAAMSLMSILTAKKFSIDAFRTPQERKQVLRAAAAAKNAVYGTVMGSGVLFFAEEETGGQTDGEWLHLCLTVAGHPIDGIDTILLNDEPVADYGNFVTWELHNDRTTADPFLLQHCPSWSEDMIGKGIAFLRVSLQFNQEKFPSGIPNIKWVKRGWHVYDPRDGQTKFTDNAALVYLHYLRTYRKVPDSDILWDHFKAAANICSEAVQIGENQYENRYTINGEFDIDENPSKVMGAMLEACAGNAVYTGGKHGILVGAYNGPAVHNIYEYQIVGNVDITPETSLADRCNAVTGKFVNKQDNWSECDFPKVSVPEYVAEDGREYVEDVNYRFVTSVHQAQRLANLSLQRKRVGRTLTIPMNFSAFAYRPGENALLHIPTLGIEGVEFRIVKWDFSLKDAIGLVVIQDTPLIYGDIVGRPIIRPPLTTLPSGGPAMPDNLRFETSPVGETIQGQVVWTNRGVVAYNEVLVRRGNVTVLSVQVPGQTCRLGGLVADQYTAMVRAVALNGAASPWATIAFTVAVPPVPTSVDVQAGNWDLSLFPKFTTNLAFGTLCEFYFYMQDIAIDKVESTAQLLGMGTSLVHSGLRPNTVHYYWVRSVNAYGKSAFFPLSAKTAYDVDSVLDIISGEIGAEALKDELKKEIEKIPVLGTAIETEQTARVDGDKALGQQITTITAKVDSNSAAIQTEATARASADSAISKRVDTVQATVGQNTASIQTVATAGTTNDGKTMNAMWSTRASLNDITGGFGLIAEQDPDGKTRVKFIVDADIFAILDRSGGKRNPFVIKDGVVYMNKLLLDNAEIGAVIAKYINVQHLVGSLIEGGSFQGGDVYIGENPNGPWSGYGKKWNACIQNSGNALFKTLVGTDCTLSGRMDATSGSFNNVTINENCNVLGTIYAQKIVGDVCRTLAATGPNFTLTFPPFNRARKIAIVGPTGTLMQVRTTVDRIRLFYVKIFVNGQMVSETTTHWQPGDTLGEFEVATQNALVDLPANTQAVVEYRVGSRDNNIELDYTLVRAGVMVASAFIQ